MLLLLAALLLPSNVQGAISDKTVYGVVEDQMGDPISGAHVTVEMWGGDWPRIDFFRTSKAAVTDSLGYYQVTFDANSWDPHNTIKVIVTYNSIEKIRQVEANGDEFQEVNVIMDLSIPELGKPVSLCAVIGVSAVFLMVMRRFRRA